MLWVKAAAAGLALAVTVAVTLLGAGPAAAATELRLSPASGPPGTEFVISGTGFASAPVELHWGSQSGPIIASAMGPEFSVKATVPDAPPNSHPVVAVVTQGTSVSTSSAAFQVETGEVAAPVVEETTTTSTTVTPATTPPPTTATPSTAPAAVELPAAGGSSTDRRVSGGVDGGVGDTTDGGSANAGTATGAPSAGAGSTGTSTVLTPPAGDATTPTVTIGPGGGPGAAPPGGQVASTAPLLPGDGVAAPALTPTRTNQSAGAVSNPALLFLGLGLVFGGGVFLAVRNRHRA